MSSVRSRSDGKHHRKHREAIPEVLAELASLHHRRQVGVRGRDHAHVHGHRFLAAHAGHQTVLQHPQQPHLRRLRQLADLVEQQRAAVRALEPAAPPPGGAREAPLLVAEQLGVDQFGRDRAAVHARERTLRAARAHVHGAGDHLLARAGLPQQQHGEVGAGHHLHALHHAAQSRLGADDGLEQLVATEPHQQRLAVRLGGSLQGVQLAQAAVVLQGGGEGLAQFGAARVAGRHPARCPARTGSGAHPGRRVPLAAAARGRRPRAAPAPPPPRRSPPASAAAVAAQPRLESGHLARIQLDPRAEPVPRRRLRPHADRGHRPAVPLEAPHQEKPQGHARRPGTRRPAR